MPTKMRGDDVVDRVAAEAFRGGVNDRAFRDDRDVRRAGTDVDDRGGAFVGRKNACTERRGQTFLHHKDLTDPGVVRCVDEGALLDVGDVRYHAHHGLQRYV